MLAFEDLKPFAARLTAAQAVIVIVDVEGELARIAPTLLSNADPTVLRILRTAGLRYFDYLKAGGRRATLQLTLRGPFEDRTAFAPTGTNAGIDIFTASEIQKLNDLADITTETPLTAAPVGLFPESPIHGLPGFDGTAEFVYPPTGGIAWLGQ